MRTRFAWFLAGAVFGSVVLYTAQRKGGVLPPSMAQTAPSRVPEAIRTPPPTRVPSETIVPPIEGLKPSNILDTFYQARPGGRIHEATDIMEPRGTPVHAMVDGVIEKLFLSKPGGNTIYEFDDAQEYCYYYAHLDRYADGIQEKQHVTRGTVIAYVGSTGDASDKAPHLHLGINLIGADKKWWKGTPINPHPVLMKALGQDTP